MNNSFLLFYSPKPRSHVRILIYRKWPINTYIMRLVHRVSSYSHFWCLSTVQVFNHSFAGHQHKHTMFQSTHTGIPEKCLCPRGTLYWALNGTLNGM